MEAPVISEKYMYLIGSPLVPKGDKCHPIELDSEERDQYVSVTTLLGFSHKELISVLSAKRCTFSCVY